MLPGLTSVGAFGRGAAVGVWAIAIAAVITERNEMVLIFAIFKKLSKRNAE